MIELAIHESLQEIWVETLAKSAGDVVRIHLAYQHGSSDLAAALDRLGFQSLRDGAVELFSNDSLARKYLTQDDFVLVTKADVKGL